MKCPNCGSENCQYITTTETHGGGISWGDACCGTVLLGPVGILCGFCGSEVHTHTKEYWICNSCGRRFSQSEAERVMQDEAKRIKEFRFYLEMQEKFGSTNAKTDLGERIKQGEKLFLSPVFTDKELISSNPFIEDERLESIKYGITEVLTKEDLVYLVMPDMRIVFADKGMIYNNFNYGRPQEITLLSEIYWEEVRQGKRKSEVVVFDEFQFLSLKPGSSLAAMLREGRKFSLAVYMSSQFLGNYSSEEIDTLMQAGNMLFFKPVPKERRLIAKYIDSKNWRQWEVILDDLNIGEAVLKGHFIVGQNQRVLTNPIKCSISLERGIENANLCASTL